MLPDLKVCVCVCECASDLISQEVFVSDETQPSEWVAGGWGEGQRCICWQSGHSASALDSIPPAETAQCITYIPLVLFYSIIIVDLNKLATEWRLHNRENTQFSTLNSEAEGERQ